MSNQDRRTQRRINVHMAVIVRIHRPLKLRMIYAFKEVQAKMVDLSQGGIALITPCNIPEQARLDLEFNLVKVGQEAVKFHGPMRIKGRVCYRSPFPNEEYRIGIAFESIKEQDKLAISQFVQQQL